MPKGTRSEGRIQEILALIDQGLDQSDVARRVGVSRQYVSQLMTPLKSIARYRLKVEVKTGRIKVPGTCSDCGLPAKLHGHHDDYTKPLDVRWLCPTCHIKEHARQQSSSSDSFSEWMAALARRKSRKMTKAQRTALALKMNAARWAKARGAK